MASAFWWASLMGAKLLAIDVSPLPGTWLFEGLALVDWDPAVTPGVLSSFHPWQSSREDTTSSARADFPGRDPGSLCCL